jgi:hypothetical protein
MPTQPETAMVPTMTRTDALALYRQFGLPPIGGGSGEEDDAAAKAAEDAAAKAKAEEEAKAKAEQDDLDKLGVGDKGKEAIRREREARKVEEDARKAAEAELAKFRTAEQEREAARKKAEEDEAIKRGEFEKLANERATAIESLTGERDGYKTKVDRYAAIAAKQVEERLKALPDEAKEDFPKDADALDQLAWVDARAQLVAKLTPQTGAGVRLPITPQANDQGANQVKSLISARTV